jgi:hypothetical protein
MRRLIFMQDLFTTKLFTILLRVKESLQSSCYVKVYVPVRYPYFWKVNVPVYQASLPQYHMKVNDRIVVFQNLIIFLLLAFHLTILNAAMSPFRYSNRRSGTATILCRVKLDITLKWRFFLLNKDFFVYWWSV